MGNDYRRGYMTYNLYGYDSNPAFDTDWKDSPVKVATRPTPPIGYQVADQPLSKGSIDGRPSEPKPAPPKIKEFNKQLIIKELEKTDLAAQKMVELIAMTQSLMMQEDADDIYGFEEVFTSMRSLVQEWANTKECLRKELELSLQTSKHLV